MTPKLVILTPVKNEAWILERFLAVATRCADLVIVLDQNSSDDSVQICRRFEHVHVVANPGREYDERLRQQLLIEEARRLVPGPRVLLALDADELVAANAIKTADWRAMLEARPGTVVFFEKPDLYESVSRCIRYATPWPLAYCDDGVPHDGRLVHSIRIPMPEHAKRLVLEQAKIVHYGLARPGAQRAKTRFYSVVENTRRTQRSVLLRRWAYAADRNYGGGGVVTIPDEEWFVGWEAQAIAVRSIADTEYHWQDFEVLRFFQRYGTRRYWLDDIWDFDWEACRFEGLKRGERGLPQARVKYPPRSLQWACRRLSAAHAWYKLNR
jgi:glycosyltransferase involved in cell wall biosynthesis